MRPDLRELEVCVVWVHSSDLLPRGGSQNLDDLDQLVDARLPGEKRGAKQQLGRHAADGPDVDGRGVVRGAEDELGGPVVAGADVGDAGLSRDEDFRGAKVAEFEDLF